MACTLMEQSPCQGGEMKEGDDFGQVGGEEKGWIGSIATRG